MIPITNEDMQKMNHAFLTSFSTQKSAAFPITHFDGPFSFLAEAIQREQFQQLKKLLGEAYFLRHSDPAIRNAAGFVFIKEMDQNVFLKLISTPSTLSDLN